jgi:hypothetical protein
MGILSKSTLPVSEFRVEYLAGSKDVVFGPGTVLQGIVKSQPPLTSRTSHTWITPRGRYQQSRDQIRGQDNQGTSINDRLHHPNPTLRNRRNSLGLGSIKGQSAREAPLLSWISRGIFNGAQNLTRDGRCRARIPLRNSMAIYQLSTESSRQ